MAAGRWRNGPTKAEDDGGVRGRRPAGHPPAATTSSNRCTRPIRTDGPSSTTEPSIRLGIMLRAGTITREMHDAARDFQAQFTIACYDTLVCMRFRRDPSKGNRAELTETQIDARRRVDAAMDALGGLGSPAGGCVWHVVGLQRSIREWAMRQGWGGRPINEKQAQGILIAGLGVLMRHYGYG